MKYQNTILKSALLNSLRVGRVYVILVFFNNFIFIKFFKYNKMCYDVIIYK